MKITHADRVIPRGIVANFVINGGGSVPETGLKGYLVMGRDATIIAATLVADQNGDAEVDILKSTYDDFPTTATICGTSPPSVSGGRKSRDTTLTDWTINLAAGDVLEFVLNSISDIEVLTVALELG